MRISKGFQLVLAVGAVVFAANATAASDLIEEVVVTAQKRTESAQDVPITMAAFAGQRLEDSGFDNFADLTMMSPSLQIGNFGSVTFINMRGIGNENTTAGGDPGVALHYDGVYLGRPVAYLFTAFDSERVEILRGPQGTLYGRNATGGSINYVTKKPTNRLEGELDLTVGDYDWLRTRAVINLPLGERARSRLVAFRETRDGYIKNAVPRGTEGNDADNFGFRAHLDLDLSDAASLLITGTYVESGGVGSQAELREPFPGSTTDPMVPLAGPPGFAFSPMGPASGVPAGNTYVGSDGRVVVNDLEAFRESKDFPESQDNDFLLLSATLNWDLPGVSFRSITAYGETSFASDKDEDYSALDLAELLLTEEAEQFSQELQVVSATDGGLQWIVGAYYFTEDAARQSRFFRSRYDVFAEIFGVESGFDVGGSAETESWAIFGQATWDLSDSFSLTGGIRYTNDEKDGFNNGFQFAGAPYSDPVADSWDEVSYRFSADWRPAQEVMLFASYSTGYKSGGINQVAVPSRGATNAIYDPEQVDAFEVGVKALLLDGRLQWNTSAYRNEYDDLQFQIFGPAGPEAFNASGATVQGIEVELLAAITETLGLDLSLGVTDSEFDDQVINGTQIGGNQVQRTPDLTYSLGLSKDWILSGGTSWRLRIEYAYTDEIFYTALNREAGFAEPGGSDLADDYDNLNVRLFWFGADEKWTLELAATNLTDEVQEGNILRGIGFIDIGGGGGTETITYNPPRQISGRLAYRF